ncbi:unnamed protein product [Blepharisma stoltei]|uniref:DIRP domain-containing protein n=1 Tax=Blepharisma stoltei TaxID=1481888 RepID=A0AAU9J502_9CILI|nr:unnamed protein product [Blepharisma stoltei]
MVSIEERMGPRWSKKELQIFFSGLSKYGTDFKSLSKHFAEQVQAQSTDNLPSVSIHRTSDMIEALYMKNKTYLNLSSANPNDFAAIIEDTYNCYEERKQIEDSKQQNAFDEDFRLICYTPAKESPVSPRYDEEDIRRKKLKAYEKTPSSARKTPNKKPEGGEILSMPVDSSFSHNVRFKDTNYSRRSFPEFVYSPSIYLNDYAQQTGNFYDISPKFLNWCKFEWFYSYVDRGFFSHNEFDEASKTLNLGETMSMYESRIIKSALGKPRRFSPNFISQERQKLQKYREAIKVLQQGKVLPTSYHDMLVYIKLNPGNVSSRLMVGQKVLAIHPGTGDLRSGSILTLDSSRYHIQFDKPELGVSLVSDIQLVPLFTGEENRDRLFSHDAPQASFICRPLQEREVLSPHLFTERFKAGVNIYAMAFLLKLLERKEALIELLKQYNYECVNRKRETPDWKPDSDFQQQYAWICVSIQAINTSISKVLEIFRLRSTPPVAIHTMPFQPVTLPHRPDADCKAEQLKVAAYALVGEHTDELRQKNFSEPEFQKMQESLKNGVVLLSSLDLLGKEKDDMLVKCVEESLSSLSPACESNREKYHELCKLVAEIKGSLSI